MTETEPEYDANELDDWQALLEYEDALCPVCKRLRIICEDPEQAWYPQRHTCWATAATDAVSRRWKEKHKDAKPDSNGVLPTDGVHIWVSEDDLTPDDDFL